MKLFNIPPTRILLVLPFCFFSLSHDFTKITEVHSLSVVHCNTLFSNVRQKCQTPLLKGYKIYKLKMTVP